MKQPRPHASRHRTQGWRQRMRHDAASLALAAALGAAIALVLAIGWSGGFRSPLF